MLLRSVSSPLLNYSCVPAPAASAPEHCGVLHLFVPAHGAPPAPSPKPGVLCRALSENDLSAHSPIPMHKKKGSNNLKPSLPLSASSSTSISVEEDAEEAEEEQQLLDVTKVSSPASSLRRLLSSSGLDAAFPENSPVHTARAALLAIEEGVGGGGGGRKVCGGGGSGDNDSSAADAYYRRMIEADPGNSLLLGNYAKFLKDVEGDVVRAQEYCERAIVANPGDGEVLALYAGLVWETSKDADRADAYFSRAVQAAPDDCYVLGSYAGFLWDAEEDNDGESGHDKPPPPPFLGATQPPSITATS